jgi:hypothetical protein
MTHVVVRKYHTRVDDKGKVERFEVGDQIDPTDEELESFPDRFRKMDEPAMRRRRSVETPVLDNPDTKSAESGSLGLLPKDPKDADKS